MRDENKKKGDTKQTVDAEIRMFKHIDGMAQKAEMALYMQKEQIDRQRLEIYDLMKQMQILKEKLRTEPRGGADKEELYDTKEIDSE